jgi:hypothetical protein
MHRTTTHAAKDAIATFLDAVSLAPRQTHKHLTLWPLLRDHTPALEYITLSEAFARGDLAIDELREGAAVPHVLAHNRGSTAVLVLFGEEIRGAMQNRIANASFLVPPHAEIVLDVSCVEHGRWSRRRGVRFESTGVVMATAIRATMAARVASSRRAGGGFHADQRELWSQIGERVHLSRAEAPSGAYADYLTTRETDLDGVAAAFHPIPGQVGFVACAGDEVVGLEAIGRPEVFAKAFPGLLRGYLIDAIDHPVARRRSAGTGAAPRFDSPEAFLAALARAPVEEGASLGLGSDLRIGDAPVGGCALVAGDVVHLTAFPAVGQTDQAGWGGRAG